GFFTASGPAPKSKQPRSAPLFALGIAFMGTLALILAGSENAWGQRYSWGARNPWVIESETPLEIQEVESFQVGFLGNYLLSHPLRSSKAQAQTLQAVSGTAFVATRLWKGASLHYQAAFLYSESPGMARGLSNPLPGLTYWPLNGSHRIHSPRFYFRQTFAFSARGNRSHENVPAGFNQLGGYEPINYLRIHFGKLDMGDLFDRHLFAPFTPGPFLFGSLQHNGAWDRPQNRLGYTYGLVAELEHQGLNIKAGMATLPEQPRGESMNWNLGGSLAGMVEASHRYHFFAQPGKFALMTYLN